MNKKRSFIVMTLLCLLAGAAWAQVPCAFDSLQQQWLSSNPQQLMRLKGHQQRIEHYRQHPPAIKQRMLLNPIQPNTFGCNPTRYVIPVVFHIDTSGARVQVSDAQVQEQIDAANEAMKNYGIQLCLAKKAPNGNNVSGIKRINGANVDNRISQQLTDLSNLVYYNPARYLNIYVVPTILNNDNTSSTYAGYNNLFPGQVGIDAIVMHHKRLGNYSVCPTCPNLDSNARGLVLVHEIGHYLGLWHTFEGGCTAGNTANTCGRYGDLCCDTRPLAALNYACPLPAASLGCSNTALYGSNFPENRSNYMDYSEEPCKNNFTPDQLTIMYSVLNGPRSELVNAENINKLALSCCFYSAWFTINNNFLCKGISNDTITLTALKAPSGTLYKWVIKDSTRNTQLYTVTDTTGRIRYKIDSLGLYNVTLQVLYSSGDTLELWRGALFEKADCSTPLPSHKANWFFGEYAGLNFTKKGVFRDFGPDQNKPTNINTYEGSTGISNPQGQLLFYGAGPGFGHPNFAQGRFELYNKFYKPFRTNPLIGDFSSTQAGIVLPAPGNGKKYYLFTTSGGDAKISSVQDYRGLRYSVIDTTIINLSNPQSPIYCEIDTPAFINKVVRVPSFLPSNPVDSTFLCGEMITAVPKCNGRDYWLITTAYNSDSIYKPYNHQLVVFSFDSATGVQYHDTSSIRLKSYQYGQIKASPDGTKLAAPGFIMGFNRITGAITQLDTMSYGVIWSCSFSGNSSLLYYLRGAGSYDSYLYQYNLADSTEKIIDTIPLLYSMSMQLGADEKIYLSRVGLQQLAVIEHPDSLNTSVAPNACGYKPDGPNLGANGQGGYCTQGLPNFRDAKFPNEIEKKIEFTQTACFNFRFTTTLCCAETFRWYFGDGDSASGKQVYHTFDSIGSYLVTVIAGSDTLRETINLDIDEPIIAGNISNVCDTSNFMTYSVANKMNNYTYEWFVASPNILNTNNFGGADVNWKQDSSTLKLRVTSAGGCKDSSEVVITIRPVMLHYNISGNQFICNGTQPNILIGDTPIGGIPPYRYQWYQSTDTGAVKNWTVLSGDTLINYQPPVVTQPTWYVRVTDPQLCPLTSNKVKVDIITFANDSIWLDTGDCDDVLGTTPTVSSGGVSYAWEWSEDGTTWETIPNETAINLVNPVFFKTTYVRRVVTALSVACTHRSNQLLPGTFSGDITYSGDTLCTGDALAVGGNSPCSQTKNIAYRWQFRKLGSTSYENLYGSSGPAQNYTHASWTDSCYMRREMTSFGKTAYSDSVLIPMRPLLINYLLTYGDTVCPSRLQKEIHGSFSCTSQKYKFQWQTTSDTNQTGSWQNINGAQGQGYSYVPPSAIQETYYRRRMIYVVVPDTTYSLVYTIKVMNPAITQQPTNITAADGELATFSISTQEMSILRWERDSIVNGFTYWQPLAGPALNTLSFTTDLCMNGRKYRALVKNLCNNTTLYSDEKVLTVTPKNYDLWARDNVNDNNLEPSPGFIWNSPDIWNRRNNDAGTEHQSAEYRISSPNHLRTIIRNEGSQASVPAKLYLYWTFASTGEDWPRCWQSDTSLGSYAGNWANYLGQKRAKGGLIGVYNLNAIPAYSTYQLNTPWTAPDPGIITGDPNSLIPVPVCFLARIVTCQDKPFGMTTPEVLNIGANVRNNNNIITKNFYVADSLPGNQYIIPSGHGNPTFAEANGKLRLRAHNCDFFNYGYILLHLDATLRSIWDTTNGSGYTVVDDSTLMVETCNEVVLENIAYKAWQQGLIGLEFVMRNDYVIHDPMDVVYNFDLEQFIGEDTVSVGGIEYAIPMHIEPIGNSGYEKRTPVAKKEILGKVSFAAYPNPFTDELKMAYHLPKAAQVTITVTNLLGQQVASIENKTYKTEGTHKLVFDATNLKEGVYFISFQAGAFVQTRKIVLMR